jgi:hypothetical protein
LNDNTLIAMAVIAFAASIPLKANIRRITGRDNKVERANVLQYLLVFLGCGLLAVAFLMGMGWELSSVGHAALLVIFYLAANLISQAFFGKKMVAMSANQAS